MRLGEGRYMIWGQASSLPQRLMNLESLHNSQNPIHVLSVLFQDASFRVKNRSACAHRNAFFVSTFSLPPTPLVPELHVCELSNDAARIHSPMNSAGHALYKSIEPLIYKSATLVCRALKA